MGMNSRLGHGEQTLRWKGVLPLNPPNRRIRDPYVRWCDRESGRPPTYVDWGWMAIPGLPMSVADRRDWVIHGIKWVPVDMCTTCSYVKHMPTMIQIRHVPDPLHRKLKVRAAQEGKSLSDYLLREIQRVAERPTMEEIMKRLARLPPVNPRVPPAQIIREERDSR